MHPGMYGADIRAKHLCLETASFHIKHDDHRPGTTEVIEGEERSFANRQTLYRHVSIAIRHLSSRDEKACKKI